MKQPAPEARKSEQVPPLAAPVSVIPGVGSVVREQLERLGITTVGELIRHFPYRYEDLRDITPIAGVHSGKVPDRNSGAQPEVNVIGVIRQFRHVRLPGRVRSRTTALIEDETGTLQLIWFGRPYLGTQLKPGMRIFGRGRVDYTLAGPHLNVSRHLILDPDEEYRGELQPVYPQTAGLPSRKIRALVRRALALVLRRDGAIELDPLPPAIARRHGFAGSRWALRAIHAPQSPEEAAAARRRMIFEEFFLLAVAAAVRRSQRSREAAPDFSHVGKPAARARVQSEFRGLLPFTLTGAQVRVIDEIFADMTRSAPMNRLLQGDVGCGKTAVAAAAALLANRAGYQVAFMAPTEILAVQQYEKLETLLNSAGIRAALLIGNLKRRTRDDILDRLAGGELDLVVGTHALIIEDVAFQNLGLVIIDEQHRFGVLQRAALRAKARGHTPHTLIMTATPIPRTLAQTVYADLEVSVIDEMPPGRKPVKTYVRSEAAKPRIFEFIRAEVEKGWQAYVVCPAIDDTERAVHTAIDQAEELRRTAFRGLRVGLLHGRMSTGEKDKVMRLFAGGLIHILISTTVVEVGMDVPNAGVMLVLDAHLFGLAQLHQLRGRVGRSAAKSYCILVAPEGTEESARLSILEETNDGFAIAEEDMKIRGTGDLVGTRQHGVADLRLANLIADYPLFLEARKDADALVAADPLLQRPAHRGLAAFLAAQAREAALRVTS